MSNSPDGLDGSAAYTHDRNGNTTASQGSTYSYDPGNRPASINGGALTYRYEGAGGASRVVLLPEQ